MAACGRGLKEDLNSLCETDTLHALWYRHKKTSQVVDECLKEIRGFSNMQRTEMIHLQFLLRHKAQMFFLWSMMSSVITGRSLTDFLSILLSVSVDVTHLSQLLYVSVSMTSLFGKNLHSKNVAYFRVPPSAVELLLRWKKAISFAEHLEHT